MARNARPPARWNRAEQALWHAYRRGSELDLATSDHRQIRAGTIVQLLSETSPIEPGRAPKLSLSGARVSGLLDLSAAHVQAPLRFHRCHFEERLVLDSARFAYLSLSECQLPEISGLSVQVDQWLGLPDSHVAGEVQLFNARIGGTAEFDGSTIDGALTLGRVVVEGSLHLRRRCEINGKLRLKGARIGGALLAHGLAVHGVINAIGAHVEDGLSLIDVTLDHPGDWGLILTEAQTPKAVLRLNRSSAGAVSLRDAHVGRWGTNVRGWPEACPVDLTGFTYDRLSEQTGGDARPTVEERLAWIQSYGVLDGYPRPTQSPSFTPRPYEQLARALRAEGHEQEARRALRSKERLRHRAMGPLGSIWGVIQDVTVGFGYRPGHALAWLAAVLTAATVYFDQVGPLPRATPSAGPTWDPFLYTLDILIPLLSLGHDTAWNPTGWAKTVTVLLMVTGWVLVTTVIAGVGRALKRQ